MMPTNACGRYRDDLALLAGGDLDLGAERDAVETHVAACDACAGLLSLMAGDRAWVARAAAEPEPSATTPSLVAPVLAHLAAAAVAEGLYRPPAARKRSDLGLMAFTRVAAAVALVSAAALLGWSILAHDAATTEALLPSEGEKLAGPQDLVAATASPVLAGGNAIADAPAESGAASVEFRPVRVHRAGGPAVSLEWESDGRETARVDGSSAYRVLASASPRDFTEARPVLVAGNSLVASLDLPSLRTPDRSVTYFRVE